MPLAAVGVVQIAVGVPDFEAVDGWQEGFPGQPGVLADDVLGARSREVVGVEALFPGGGGDRITEDVGVGGVRIAIDAVSGGREIERDGVGMSAVVPVVVDADLDGLAAVRGVAAAVLHSGAVVLLVGAAGERLCGLVPVPGQPLGLGPERSAVGAVEGEAQGRLVGAQGDFGGAQLVAVALVAPVGGGRRALRQDDVLAGRVGEGAVRGEFDTEGIGGDEADAGRGVAGGEPVHGSVVSEACDVTDRRVGRFGVRARGRRYEGGKETEQSGNDR